MDTGADFYSVSYPQGHLLPHSSLATLTVTQGRKVLYFAAGVHRGQICSEQLFLNQKMPFYTSQQED